MMISFPDKTLTNFEVRTIRVEAATKVTRSLFNFRLSTMHVLTTNQTVEDKRSTLST